MTDEDLSLFDWTGRQVRRDERGTNPAELAPILERLQIVEEQWLETILNFGLTFHTVAGLAATVRRRGS